jgi:hypothetical protein
MSHLSANPGSRRFRYAGPARLAAAAEGSVGGVQIGNGADLAAWCDGAGSDAAEPFTYVVDLDGRLRVAPRRSELVACARGADVLAAGEIGFSRIDGAWAVAHVSNLSTGYCPDAGCWPAVQTALAHAGIAHPGRFTDQVVFRGCTACGQRNLVKDDEFVCAVCDEPLPQDWNFDTDLRS